jgi:uncharacterized protein YkwD
MWLWKRLQYCLSHRSVRRRSGRRMGFVEALECRIVPTAVTSFEQYFLELINRARKDPVAEATRLGTDLNEGLAAGTLSPGARQPLALNDFLQASIEGHLQDELANNYFGHGGSDGSTVQSRIEAAGYTGWSTIGENLAIQYTSGSVNVEQFVTDEYVNLFKDTTVPDRGHRINIVNGSFKETGSAVQTGLYQGLHAVDTGNDFGAKAGNSFLTGVIYTDSVSPNNFYNVGEGLGGISVDVTGPGNTAYHTIANAVGGYQIALPAGTYSVRFFGVGMTLPIIKQFTIGSLNVKVDANTRTDPGTSGPPVLSGTNPLTYVENGSPVFIDSSITVTDIGRTTLGTATITLTNFVSSQDVLGFVANPATMGNIALVSNSNGVLTLSSAGRSATLAQWQTALRAITYANTSEFPSTVVRNATFAVDDGQADNHASNLLGTVVTVTSVDDSPSLKKGGFQFNYVQNDPATPVFPTLVVADVDNTTLVGATVSISGNYAAGQDLLVFTNTAAISGAFDPVRGVLTLTGSDTIAHYQAALQTVGYRNTQNAPSTAIRTFSVQANDGMPANNLSNAVTRLMTISSTNPAPVLKDVESTPMSYKGADPATLITSTLAVTDPDSDYLVGATVWIFANYQNGADVLAFTNTATISGSFNASTGKLVLTGSDTASNYRAALRSVTFANSSLTPVVGVRSILFQVNDGASSQNLSNFVNRSISVTSGSPPVLAGIPSTVLAFTERDPATLVAPALTVADLDSLSLNGATIQITRGYIAGQDKLTFINSAGVTALFDSLTGTLSLTGIKPVTAYQTMLQSVSYQNTHNNPNTASRAIEFKVIDDRSNPSNVVSRNVSVTAINDPPVIYSVESSPLSYIVNSPAIPISASLLVTDPDSDFFSSATIQITTGYQSGSDTLTFANTAKITAVFDPASGKLTLTGVDSVSNYRSAFRSVGFSRSTSNPTIGSRTISFQANDGSVSNNLSNSVTRVVNFIPGVPPVLSGVPATGLSYPEKAPALLVAPDINIADSDSLNIAGATIQITGNYTTFQDRLSFANTASVTAVFDSVTGTLSLSGIRSLVAYRTMLRSVAYQNIHNNPNLAMRTIQLTVIDDARNVSNAISRSIGIVAVNDPPVLSGVETSLLVYPSVNSPAMAVSPGILVTDPDSDFLTAASIRIAANYQVGQDVLSFTNTSKLSGTWDPSTGTLAIVGTDTVSNYRTALRNVLYQNTGFVPSLLNRSIAFQVSDLSGGTLNSNIVTRNITIN